MRTTPLLPLLAFSLLLACKPSAEGSTTPSTVVAPLHPDAIPFDDAHWEYEAREHEVTRHLGRPALRLHGGFALLRDVELAEGTIEFDMAFEPDTAFAGAAWHVQDTETFERFYLRVFLSGSREATQYTPYFNGVSGWQLYHGPGYNAKVRFRGNTWVPIKIVISSGRAEVYVGGMARSGVEEPTMIEPTMAIPRLELGATNGRVGLFVEPLPVSWGVTPIWFSNVRVTPSVAPPLRSPAPEDRSRPGRVPKWQVSEAFSEAKIATLRQLPADEAAAHQWTPLPTEPEGLANLARVQGAGKDRDTVFTRVTVISERAQTKRLDFGFSEKARVYLGGRLLWSGDDTWSSRDITFQGVVGYWDSVYLPLVEGPNELWFAVTENIDMHGGWGVLAAFEDLDGIRFP
ncbi:MAG: hypothetical protein AAGF11_01895 [Myxococcota bacterium]